MTQYLRISFTLFNRSCLVDVDDDRELFDEINYKTAFPLIAYIHGHSKCSMVYIQRLLLYVWKDGVPVPSLSFAIPSVCGALVWYNRATYQKQKKSGIIEPKVGTNYRMGLPWNLYAVLNWKFKNQGLTEIEMSINSSRKMGI